MFHVEMRHGPQQVRSFNLSEEQVLKTFITPIRGDRVFTYEDIDWDPRALQIQVLEGPKLRMDQLTLGRGWVEAERQSEDVTSKLMAGARPKANDQDAGPALKNRLLGRLSAGPLPFADIPPMASDLMPGQRASQQLAVAEMAVWELLHLDKAVLFSDGQELDKADWEPTVLSSAAWFGVTPVMLGLA